MTVATQSNFVVFLGDDVAVTFPFTFPVYDAAHLFLYLQDTTTKALVLVNDTDYTVAGVGDESGGSVTLDTAASSDNNLIIARIVPLTQDLDVLNQGGFYPENVEAEFDLQEMQIQQHKEILDRTVRGQITETWPNLDPPPLRRAQLLGFTDDEFAYPTTDIIDILVGLLGAILVAGPGISIVVGDGIITISNTAMGNEGELQECWLLEDATDTGEGGGGSGDAEFIRDVIGAALGGVGCTITIDDPADTITITVTGAVDIEGVYDAIAAAITAGDGILVVDSDVGNTTTISADPEFIRDTIGTAIVGGVGITSTVDDSGNIITLDNLPKVLSVVSSATVTPTFAYDQVDVTAQAANLTVANPTGTALHGHGILINITDNGTSRTIAWGNKFRVFDDALPTATIINKKLIVGAVYDSADDKWDVLGVRREA